MPVCAHLLPVVPDALDVGVVALGVLLLLNRGDDAPRRTPGANHVLVPEKEKEKKKDKHQHTHNRRNEIVYKKKDDEKRNTQHQFVSTVCELRILRISKSQEMKEERKKKKKKAPLTPRRGGCAPRQ
jgi:hypothetical protein